MCWKRRPARFLLGEEQGRGSAGSDGTIAAKAEAGQVAENAAQLLRDLPQDVRFLPTFPRRAKTVFGDQLGYPVALRV